MINDTNINNFKNWFKHGLNKWPFLTVFILFKPIFKTLVFTEYCQQNQGFEKFFMGLGRNKFRVHNPEVSGSTPDSATK